MCVGVVYYNAYAHTHASIVAMATDGLSYRCLAR